MIKLSLQSLCYRDTFNAGEIDLFGMIDKANEYRLDGIDIHFAHFASTDRDYLEEVRMATLKAGLHICYIGVSNNFGMEGDEQQAQIENMKKWIDVAPMRWAFRWCARSAVGCRKGETEETIWPTNRVGYQRGRSEYGASKGVDRRTAQPQPWMRSGHRRTGAENP